MIYDIRPIDGVPIRFGVYYENELIISASDLKEAEKTQTMLNMAHERAVAIHPMCKANMTRTVECLQRLGSGAMVKCDVDGTITIENKQERLIVKSVSIRHEAVKVVESQWHG